MLILESKPSVINDSPSQKTGKQNFFKGFQRCLFSRFFRKFPQQLVLQSVSAILSICFRLLRWITENRRAARTKQRRTFYSSYKLVSLVFKLISTMNYNTLC